MTISRAQLLMLLLAAPGPRGQEAEPIQGTTRLQKLLFLLEHEAGLKANAGPDFAFSAYKFGPVSKDLYDDLEKLENLGFLEADSIAEPSETEIDEYGLAFDDLMGEEEQESKSAFEERRFRLTEHGLRWLRDHSADGDVVDRIRKVKGKYGALSLQDLLKHVYTRYPDMTTASEIRARVLGG